VAREAPREARSLTIMARKHETPAVRLSQWLTDNLGKGWSAPLTGQDWSALKAAAEIMGCYSYSDQEGRHCCLVAFKSMVLTMQPSCRWLAFHAIAHVMDWSTRWTIWRACGLAAVQCRECKFAPRPVAVRMPLTAACNA
jgi:hypothetical protein